jgi:hypothetical protein
VVQGKGDQQPHDHMMGQAQMLIADKEEDPTLVP